MKNANMIEKLNAEMQSAITASTDNINSMKVIDLRKLAPKMGIKNAKKHNGAELKEMLVAAANKKLAEVYEAKIAEAEAEAKAKADDKKPGKCKKAAKVSDDQVEDMANAIINGGMSVDELALQNRKVLIVVMKKLRCKRWYRTYDKPTMVALIVDKMAA